MLSCNGGIQPIDSATSEPSTANNEEIEPTATNEPPMPGPTSTSTIGLTTVTTPTPKPIPMIVGTVNFQIDVQQVAGASQLEQASIVGPDLLRLKDGQYRLYLQSRADQNAKNGEGVNIISLISPDGIQWAVEPGIRIQHGSDSDVDYEAGEPGVYLGLDDKYHMAYTGRFMGVRKDGSDQKMHRLVFAVSDDGLTWTKLNQHYADPDNINDFASSADVHILNGGYVMYYTGERNIIKATSQDGLTWVRQEITIKAGHDSTMVKLDNTYYMFVKMPKDLAYGRNPDTESDLLVMAISDDGVNWSNNYYQVVVKDLDGREVGPRDLQDPGSIVLSDGTLRVFLNDDGGNNIYSIIPTSPLPKGIPQPPLNPNANNGKPEDKYECNINSDGYCIFSGSPHKAGLNPGTKDIVTRNGEFLFSLDEAVAVNSSGVLEAKGTPAFDGDELIKYSQDGMTDDEKSFHRVMAIIFPIRNALMYDISDITQDKWDKLVFELQIRGIKDKTFTAGATPRDNYYGRQGVFELAKHPNGKDIHHDVMKFLEEAGLYLLCHVTSDDFNQMLKDTHPENHNPCEEAGITSKTPFDN